MQRCASHGLTASSSAHGEHAVGRAQRNACRREQDLASNADAERLPWACEGGSSRPGCPEESIRAGALQRSNTAARCSQEACSEPVGSARSRPGHSRSAKKTTAKGHRPDPEDRSAGRAPSFLAVAATSSIPWRCARRRAEVRYRETCVPVCAWTRTTSCRVFGSAESIGRSPWMDSGHQINRGRRNRRRHRRYPGCARRSQRDR